MGPSSQSLQPMTTPTPDQLKPGTRVFHLRKEKPGTVMMQPRARSEMVCCKFDGLISQQYYRISEVVLGEVAPLSGQEPTPAPAPPPPSDPLDTAITASAPHAPDRPAPGPSGDPHQGDLTLEYLLGMRRQIARNLEALDERLAEIRVTAMLRAVLGGIRIDGESGKRAGLSVEALKIKRDTAQLLEAANRLHAKGAL